MYIQTTAIKTPAEEELTAETQKEMEHAGED